jgi:putative transposase
LKCTYYETDKRKYCDCWKKIKLPKLGLVTFAKSKEVAGRIVNATIRRNPSGKYFVSLLAETEIQVLPKTHSACGVDVGLKYFAVLSDGTIYSNPKFFRTLDEKLVKAKANSLQTTRTCNETKTTTIRSKELSKAKEKSCSYPRTYHQCSQGLFR